MTLKLKIAFWTCCRRGHSVSQTHLVLNGVSCLWCCDVCDKLQIMYLYKALLEWSGYFDTFYTFHKKEYLSFSQDNSVFTVYWSAFTNFKATLYQMSPSGSTNVTLWFESLFTREGCHREDVVNALLVLYEIWVCISGSSVTRLQSLLASVIIVHISKIYCCSTINVLLVIFVDTCFVICYYILDWPYDKLPLEQICIYNHY